MNKKKFSYLLLLSVLLVFRYGFALADSASSSTPQYPSTGPITTVSVFSTDAVAGSQRDELYKQASLVEDAIKKMIAAGSSPEKIMFTGVQSPDDVFGSGKVDIKALTPPPEACSPSPCPNWKFLPAAKKNNGWYVYGVGTSSADIIAYLPGISPRLCANMQLYRLHVKSIHPPKQTGAPFDPQKPGVYSPEGSATTIKTENAALDGQLEGCFDNHVGSGPGSFVYYRVLLAQ